MTFLVTGGAGFIGSFLVDHLFRSGEDVRVVDDGSTGNLGRLNPAIQIFETDISRLRERDWAEILRPSDTVFHLAARKLNTPGVSDDNLLATNVMSTIALARAARSVGVRKMIFASSLYAYGHRYAGPTGEDFLALPQTLYGMSKLAGEHTLLSVLESSDVEWVSARLYFVYGPKQFPGTGYKSVIVKNFERLRDGLQPMICGSGNQELDYIYVEDVVRALIRLEEAGACGEVYNVSSGNGISIRDLTGLMISAAERPDLQPMWVDADWTEGTARVGNNSKLFRELGWAPQVSLKLGLEQTWFDICSMKGY